MTARTHDDDPRVAELLLRWEELHDAGGSVSPEELCLTCPELTEELGRRIALLRQLDPLLDGTTTADGRTHRPAAAGAAARQSATARAEFRDLRFHAAGALGEVYTARNAELNREVALKFLRRERLRDPDSCRRFLQEAEVTGRLEHPGVVPIYALGTDAGGSPCYAMRFIRGETLQDAIDAFHAAEKTGRDPSERSLAARDLLNRFVSICGTMAYAHSRGILHRDLKPRNVMLGKYDETLVVDWGLAKPFQRDEAARSVGEETLTPGSGAGEGRSDTPTVGAVGTPAYMSPEQAEARWDLVGPASDIFALGGILYAILTGRAPYQGTKVGEILEKVKRCEFPPPRQIKPGAPRGLEAVCLKAMARRPGDRYASALELAADVRRWLADEPLTAYPEPAAARAGRWVRRHKPMLAASAALLAAAVVGLAINNELVRRQRDLARRAEAGALVARAEAERSRQQEAAARAEAEASLALARSAVDRMLVKVADDQLPNVPGLGALRKDIAREALRFAREFLKRRPDDRAVRIEAAMILRRFANIERMTGDFPVALPHYEESEAIYRRLVDDFPDRPRHRDLLAQLETDFAEALKMASRLEEALIHYDRAEAMARDLLAARPDDPNARRTLALVQAAYGPVLHEEGRTREGLARCDEAVSLFSELSRRQPLQSPVDPLLHLMALVDRSALQRDAGRLAEAEDALARAVALARSLLEKDKDDANARYYLAVARCTQGTILAEDRGRPADAEAAFDESFRHLTGLRAGAPEVRFYRPALAEAQSGRGAARLVLDRLADADADARAAQQALEAIVSEDPHDARSLELLASTLARRARIARKQGDRAGAAALRDRAVARLESVARAHPDHPRARRALDRLRADRDADGKAP